LIIFEKHHHLKVVMKFLVGTLFLSTVALVAESFSPFVQPATNSVPRSSLKMASTAEKAETYTVTPIKSLDGTVTLPGSKSLSNRCLLLAALSEGKTNVDNLLESDDIRYMLEALDQLQVPVERHSAESVTVTGQNGPINSPDPENVCELFLGNAGTAMRPLAAALCMGKGKFVLDGVPRMRERPIADLIDGLQQLGADVTCVEETGCPPVTINANGLKGGKVRRIPICIPCILCRYSYIHKLIIFLINLKLLGFHQW
jgi:3-phosphoshikimate 1-carboxyvinyltransferase